MEKLSELLDETVAISHVIYLRLRVFPFVDLFGRPTKLFNKIN